MGTNECSQSASKSSWDSQDFVDVNMVLKMAHFTSILGHNELNSLMLGPTRLDLMNGAVLALATQSSWR